MKIVDISLIKSVLFNVLHNTKVVIYKHTCIKLEKNSRIYTSGRLLVGTKECPRSKIETRLYLKKNAKLKVQGTFSIGFGCDIRVFEGARLTIGTGYCNAFDQIVCANEITIGDDVAIARGVVIRDTDAHVFDGHEKTESVHIGNHVWIGSNAMILKGVTVGDGAVIAAGAIVTKNVPPNSLVAGVPARVVKKEITWEL